MVRSQWTFGNQQGVYSCCTRFFWAPEWPSYVPLLSATCLQLIYCDLIVWEERILTPSDDKTKNHTLINPFDPQGHAQLRKLWNKAFGTGPLNDYADLLISKAPQLNQHFMELCESSLENHARIDFAKWMSIFLWIFIHWLKPDSAWHRADWILWGIWRELIVFLIYYICDILLQ